MIGTDSELLALPDEQLSRKQREWRAKAQASFPFFCKHLRIRIKNEIQTGKDSEGATGPFIWNNAQKIVWAWMLMQLKAGVPIRLVVLKARQFGISTLFCAWIFWWMWRKMQVRAIIAAKQKSTTLNALSETMDRFYQSLPEGFRPTLRAKGAQRLSKDEMYFQDRGCTCLYIAADLKESGRGDALDMALCTEVASYSRARDFFAEINPALAKRKDSTRVMESTAQPGYFWDQYKLGKKRNQSVFIPWSAVPDLYSKPLKKGQQGSRKVWRDAKTNEIVGFTKADYKEMEFLNRQHKIINEQIGIDLLKDVTLEQMYWWHNTCEEDYEGDEEWMNQEFPRDDVSAFEKSVRGAFRSVIPIVRKSVEQTQTDSAFNDAITATLECDTLEDSGRESHEIRVIEEDRLDFERTPGILIMKWPVKGYFYTIGVDVADEIGSSMNEDDAAFSVISVYCCNTREQVAEWRGSIDPHDLGDEVAKVGYLYNTGLINIEYNNMGVTTVDRVTKYLDYPNRFRWPKFDEAGKLTKKEMWWTDEKTKQLLIGSLRSAIKKGLYQVRSPGLQEELTAYQVIGGKFEAGPESYADRIIAAALSWIAVEQSDFGLDKVLGSVEEEFPDKGFARKVLKVSSTVGVPMPPERRLPPALAEELGDAGKITDDGWGIPEDFLVA